MNRAAVALAKEPLLTNPSNIGLKNISVKIEKIPVLSTGTAIATKIDPTTVFFLKAFIMKPATSPATVVLSKHAKIVPIGLTTKKTDNVLGEIKTITPQTSPRNPPTIGPYRIAPIQIGIRDKLILANPGWM